jgi:hypothetical protein
MAPSSSTKRVATPGRERSTVRVATHPIVGCINV